MRLLQYAPKIGHYAFEQCFKKHLLNYASKKISIMLKIMPLILANNVIL